VVIEVDPQGGDADNYDGGHGDCEYHRPSTSLATNLAWERGWHGSGLHQCRDQTADAVIKFTHR
jgi:hypothetical protein